MKNELDRHANKKAAELGRSGTKQRPESKHLEQITRLSIRRKTLILLSYGCWKLPTNHQRGFDEAGEHTTYRCCKVVD